MVYYGDYGVLWWLWCTMVIMVNYGDYCDYGDCGDYGEEWWMSHQRHHMRITSFWAKKVYSIHPGLNEELDLYGGQECDIKSHLDNISLCVHLSPVTVRYITDWYLVTHHLVISCHTPVVWYTGTNYWLTNQVFLSQIVSYQAAVILIGLDTIYINHGWHQYLS